MKELKRKAEEGDPVACYTVGLSYDRRNYDNMIHWLHKSAKGGYLPAMVELTELYTAKRSLLNRLDEEQFEELNDFACFVMAEEANEDNRKLAYTLFRIASKNNLDALKSLVYCKFEGIGVKKNTREAFDMIYANSLNEEMVVLKSSTSEGMSYRPKKSKVGKNVKRKHQKNALSNAGRNIFLFIFALPAFVILGELMDNENRIRSAGGYEVGENLRGNAMGGACLMVVASVVWSYFICTALSALILYLSGIESYWKWGFFAGVPGCLMVCWFLMKINYRKLLK